MLTPVEFDFAIKDFNEQNLKKQKFDAELMRLQTIYLMNANLPRESQILSPQELIRFPWEKEEIIDSPEPDWERIEREVKGIE
jgi:hypothetical protein